MRPLACARCAKKLSRKMARLIDGKTLCSTCMFASAPRVCDEKGGGL